MITHTIGHTPGPWTDSNPGLLGPDGRVFQIHAGEELLAEVFELPANARLIAAAPELLAVLRELVGWCALEARPQGGKALVMGWDLDKARATIAKAEGR